MNNSIDNPHKIRCLPPMEGDKFGFPFDTWLLPEGPEDEKNFIKLCEMTHADFKVVDHYNKHLYRVFKRPTESELQKIIKELNNQPLIAIYKSKWIKCSERLPEPLEEVLVCLGGMKMIDVARFDPKFDNRFVTSSNVVFTKDNITHWMPLPELPKE